MKTIALLILLCFGVSFSYAQQTTAVKAVVADSASKAALSLVTLEVYEDGSAKPVKAIYTNQKGVCNFSVKPGNITLVFSHTGYAQKKITFSVSSQPVVLDTVYLAVLADNLKSVTVSTRKQLVELTDDKIVYNAESDPAAKTEMAIDILRKTPFVTVDGDNNVSLNGQSNFKVLLNGRETAMFAQNVKEALRSFPGALILRIEVITSPSAKYDAEGIGGIINIITKKKMKGYNGSVSGSFSSMRWFRGSLNYSMKVGKIGVSVSSSVSGINNSIAPASSTTIAFEPAFFTRRRLAGDRNTSNRFQSANAEVNWELDSMNVISAYVTTWKGLSNLKSYQTVETDFLNNTNSVSYFDSKSDSRWGANSIGTDYIRKFSSSSEKEFSIRFNASIGKDESLIDSYQDNPGTDRYAINNSRARNNEYTIQSDFIQPLYKDRKLETGVKLIIRKAFSDFESFNKFQSAESYKLNNDNTDHFNYDQNVYSLYGSYVFKVKKATFRAGIRGEYTDVNGNFVTAKAEVNQSYLSVIPNLQVSLKFSKAYTLVTTYTQRLQRPAITNLNPFINNNDSLNISYGNPDLDAQKVHTIFFQNRFVTGSTFWGISLGASYCGNMITQYSVFNPATGVTTTTSSNIGKEVQVFVHANVNTKITAAWSVNLNGGVRYNNVSNKYLSAQRNSGVGGSASMNTAYTLSKRFSATGQIGFNRPTVSLQARQNLNVWYNTGAAYKFFNEKLSANLSLDNFLQKFRPFFYTVKDKYFQTVNENTQPFRKVSLSLAWNFGKLRENVSKKKGVYNDDVIGR